MKNRAAVILTDEQDRLSLTDELCHVIDTVVNTVLLQEGFDYDCEVSVLITDNQQIRLLNRQHRGNDNATDVLSFPMLTFDDAGNIISDDLAYEGPLLLGDIVISLERAMQQAQEYGHSLAREVGFLCAHSVLHLLGYDHELGEQQRRVMREKEEAALAVCGLLR